MSVINGTGLNNILRGNGFGNEINGLGGDDTLFGRGGNDTLNGGAGSDELNGGFETGANNDSLLGDATNDSVGGQETLIGGVGNDTMDGGANTDLARYINNELTAASFTANGSNWTVSAGTEGTDQLTNVEQVLDADGDVFLLVGSGGYGSIQAAVDAASDGDTILIASGTYTGDVTVNGKALTFRGQGESGMGATTIAGQITVSGTIAGTIRFEDLAIDATGKQYGILLQAAADTGAGASLELDDVAISNASQNGLLYLHPSNGSRTDVAPANELFGSISIVSSSFTDNGATNGGGRGGVNLFGFNGALTVTDTLFDGTGAGKAFAVTGSGRPLSVPDANALTTLASLGPVVFSNNTFQGGFGQDAVAFYYFTDIPSLTASGNVANTSAPWGLLNMDGVGGTIDASGFFSSASNGAGRIVVLQGLASADAFTGTANDDFFDGRNGIDNIQGGGGNDAIRISAGAAHAAGETIDGGAGVDTIFFNPSGAETLTLTADVTNIEIVSRTGAHPTYGATTVGGAIDASAASGIGTINGSDGADVLIGGAGGQQINGGGAEDTLDGGADNDTLNGGSGVDSLVGGAGNDSLDGGTGNDTMAGGLDDDTYAVDDSTDEVFEDVGEGDDLVISTVDYTLSANVERLTLVGSGLAGTGNGEANTIIGTAGEDTLDGGEGADRLVGGDGNDVYYVDQSDDVVVEDAGEGAGIDLVNAAASYTLGDNVENLVLTGSDDLDGTGNELANVITGNEGYNSLSGLGGNDSLSGGDGEDRLDGGTGNDTMAGGDDGDIYWVDSASDSVVEEELQGDDSVFSSVDHTLASDVESLYLVGTADEGTGNDLDNYIEAADHVAATLDGVEGNDVLFGAEGSDSLIGGQGSDAIFGGEGNDTAAGGDDGDSLYGNEGADVLRGEAGDDLLAGSSDQDELIGGTGNDTMFGGSSADTLDGGDGSDTDVADYSTTIYSTATFGVSAGRLTVTIGGVTDIITNTERLNFLDRTVLLVDAAGLISDVTSVASAVTDANGVGGDVTVLVAAGSYAENVVIGRSDLQLLSLEGRATTTIAGNDAGSELGAIQLAAGLSNVQIGDTGRGFTVNGLNGNGAIEKAAIYLQGNHTGHLIRGNEVVAEGDHGLASEGSGDLDNITIDGNIFSGQTFVGTPEGDGFGNQFAVGNNVPRQLVVLGNGGGGSPISSNIVFSNNQVTGIAGATSGVDTASAPIGPQGNTLVTIDAMDSLVEDNTFSGFTDRFGTALRVRGPGTDVIDNTLDHTGGGGSRGIFVQHNNGSSTFSGNVMNGGAGGDNITSMTPGADTLNGNGGADTLVGSAGGDLVDGGAGNDLLAGTVSDLIGDTLIGGADTDTLQISGSGALSVSFQSNGIEHIVIAGTNATGVDAFQLTGVLTITGNGMNNAVSSGAGAQTLSGGGGDDSLRAFGGDDSLDGGTGNDTMEGGDGNDTMAVDSASDSVVGGDHTDLVRSTVSYSIASVGDVENLTLLGAATSGTGNGLDNVITGNANENTLDGGAGNDTLVGGDANDTYIVDSSADVVTEAADEGTDQVNASASFTLGANVENLTLTGGGNIDGTGNSGMNVITGNSGDNLLDGGEGPDSLSGGGGNDTVVTDGDDTVAGGLGTDLIRASVSVDLSTDDMGFENIELTGTGNTDATGTSGNNSITGNSGDNMLDGGEGLDSMAGGAGNDTYFVDDAGDMVTEALGAGTDEVRSTISYALTGNVERLTLLTAGTAGTGNGLDNTITGSTGGETLDGGAGNDSLDGGVGNDLYVLDSGTDTFSDAGGADTVQASISVNGGDDIEVIVLSASGISGTGGAGAQTVLGANGGNTLDGGTGADSLAGGNGNDVFIVDNAGDLLSDTGGSADLVRSAVDWTLAAGFENLTLTAAAIGTGNGGDNSIIGSAGSDSLFGNGGFDTLVGGNGNDTLLGGSGSDSVSGGAGDDLIFGRGGDTYDGGADTDTLDFTSAGAGVAIDLRSTAAQNTGTLGNIAVANVEIVLTGSGNDSLIGTAAAETLSGGNNADTIEGGDGGDSLDGGDGIDWVSYANAADGITLNLDDPSQNLGEAASDTLSGFENVLGSAFDDIITGREAGMDTMTEPGADMLVGGGGNDLLEGLSGADTLVGNSGEDTFAGGDGNDLVTYVSSASGLTISLANPVHSTGDAAGDVFFSVETVAGSNFADSMVGSINDDGMDGGAGNDTLSGGLGGDTLNGGADVDTVSYAFATTSVTVNLASTSVQNTGGGGLDRLFSIESAIGSAQGDNLVGSTVANRLEGGLGNDVLSGNAGTDTLLGGDGTDNLNGGTESDRLQGGNGRDTLTGGAGVDTFVWASVAEGGSTTTTADRVSDYNAGGMRDLFDLSGIGGLSFIGGAAFSAANQVRVQEVGALTQIQVNTDANLATTEMFIVLTGIGHGLMGSDFILV